MSDTKNRKNIDELYVILSSDEEEEGIFSLKKDGVGFQCVSGSMEILEKVLPFVEETVKPHAASVGKKLHIVKFSKKEIIREI